VTIQTIRALSVAIVTGLVLSACARETEVKKEEVPVTAKNAPEIVAPQPASIGVPGESVVSEFNRRVEQYVDLRKQLAGSLDRLPNKPTPSQIDANQRALGALMAKARADAKLGDVFVPEMQAFIRGLVRRVVTGPDGARIKASLMDENPMGVKIAINGRYPDTVPLSTMPPDILAALPKLPEDMQYRFVGNRLILFDVASHVIVDYVDNTFET
jgi:hypothetical protein